MIKIDDGGSTDAAIKRLEGMAAMLGPSREAVIVVSERSDDILHRQKEQGRDVLSWHPDEAQSALEIAEVHITRARDAGVTVEGAGTAARAMWQELGEYFRDRIAAKINDTTHIAKKALSESYAAWKAKHFGAGLPILVASREMLEDVKNATVEIRDK